MLNCPLEFRHFLYDLFTIIISSAALLAYNLCQYKAKKPLLSTVSYAILAKQLKDDTHNRERLICILTIAEIVLISLFQHGLVSVLNTLTGNLLNTGTNYFGMVFFMPIMLFLYCWLLGINPFKQLDLITPAYPLALFFMKIGCFCVGCCRGMFFRSGLYNYKYHEVEFPVQLVEASLALLIFLFLHFYRKKAKEGTLMPTYIVLYCATRFFSEFLRGESSVLGPLKMYHILCLIGLAIGFFQLFLLSRYRVCIEDFFNHNLPARIQKRKSANRTDS